MIAPARAVRAAAILAAARRGGPPVGLLPADLMPADNAEGYAVQAELNAQLATAGLGPVVGHKVGCTTKVMQQYMKIDEPCAGEVFGETVFRRRADLRLADYHHIGVECEIAVLLGSDMDRAEPYDRGSAAVHIEAAMGGIELVDDRYVDWPSLPTPLLIADDFFNAGVVLADPLRDWRALDLATVAGTLWIDGEKRSTGVGADILGHPLEALAWLANLRRAQGRPLKAGEFVMLGSVVRTVHFRQPAEVVADLGPLGRIEVAFD